MQTKFQLGTVCVNILMLLPKVGVFDSTFGYDVYVQSLSHSIGDHWFLDKSTRCLFEHGSLRRQSRVPSRRI